jgi:hypothetical protein
LPVYYLAVGLSLLITAAILAVDAGATVPPDAGKPIWLMAHAPQVSPFQKEYQLRRAGGGYVYEERAFQARVARDGVVTFHDRRAFFDHVGLVRKPAPPTGESGSLQEIFFGHASKRPQPVAPLEPLPRSPAQRLEPSEVCPVNSSCYALPDGLVVGSAGVTMDLTDEIMRALGQDPYRAEKARFLAATFEVRIKLAVAARWEAIRKSLVQLPDALADLWGDTRYSARERRRVLFELWCETDSTPEGVRAANAIQTFIQRRLPCGSPDAYTPAKLQSCQGSTPGRLFSPYGACEK